MYIAYIDESGDDGYPEYSSPIFILSAIYLYYQNWHEIYYRLVDFRRCLNDKYNLPIKLEIHTKNLILLV